MSIVNIVIKKNIKHCYADVFDASVSCGVVVC